MPAGMMPAPMTLPTHSPASSDEAKPMSTARAPSGFLRMRTVISVTTPSSPAEPHDLARHEHQLTPEQVVGGHAVFEAVHAARILRHIAADRAGDLRGGIGRIVKAGGLDCLRDGESGDARFDDGEAVSEIDLADTIELGHAEKHAIGKGQRAARKRG